MASPAPILRFPPFPAPPDGVVIVQFKEFTESGIQIFSSVNDDDGEVEIDGRGIPTVQLRVKHDTDQCKSNTKRKRDKKKIRDAEGGASRPVRRLEWWEQWEESEHLRVFSYDPNLSRVDRLFQAASDFKVHRTWPPAPLGIQALWDQFRLFIGLLANTPVWRKPSAGKTQTSGAVAIDDDDDDDTFSDEETEVLIHADNGPNTKLQVELEPDALMEVDDDAKEDKLEAFLNDPEHATKVFLSSHMRKQGLIWSDRNLTSTPALISCFLRFLQRNRVLHEPTHARGLQNAIAVVDLASKELPLTAKVAKVLPDALHKAFVGCWGERVEGYKTLGCWEVKDKSGDEDERDSKRCKVSAGPGVDDDSCFSLGKSTATEVNVEIPENLDTGWGAAVEESNDSANGDWGAGGTGWGDDDGMGWGGGVTTVDCSAWEPPTRDTLLTFLGPTVLPLTHETGVVEMSVRRIKEVRPVSQGEGGGRKGGGTGPDPEGVEAELGSRFAKVVLEPWVGWNSGEEVNMSKPRILETSRGAVVGVDKATVESGGKEATKPHDPSNDDIVLLADPGVLGTLSVGMGLGATWIQVVRQDQVQEGGKKGRKGKGKERKTVEKYWYLEELTMILPSYYM